MEGNEEELRRIIAEPLAFAEALTLPTGGGRRRFGAAMADFQRRDFNAMAPALIALKEGRRPLPGRFWLERTKGASKDTDLAVALLWLVAFSGRPLAIQVGAADRDQADELRKAALGIVRANAWLDSVVKVTADGLVNQRTGSAAEIIAADVAGSHGARPDLLILNELTHLTKREFAENLMDNASKVPHGVVIVATNAGFLDSWQWGWREEARTNGRWCFAAFVEPAPWLDPQEIEAAARRNSPSRFNRLWRGIWSSGAGDGLAEEDVAAAVRPNAGPMEGNEQGFLFYAGLDLGIKHDHSALCVVGKHVGWAEPKEPAPPVVLPREFAAAVDLGLIEGPDEPEQEFEEHAGTNRLRLAGIEGWTPPPGGQVDLTAVEEAALEAHRRFGAVIHFDPFQAALLAQRLTRQGVAMVEVAFTGRSLDEMASVMLETFRSREIELYADEGLAADLKRLRIVERSYGHRLEASRDAGGHCDKGTALTLAVLGARRGGRTAPAEVQGELICSP